MKFRNYEWDEENVEHILKHLVTPNEVEECCYNDPLVLKTRRGRYLVLGQTDTGRYLFIIVEYKGGGVVRAITARDMDKKDRGLYQRKKGRR